MLKKFIVGELRTNCYCVYNEVTLKAFLIDPGDDYKKINRFIKEKELELQAIFLTHGHIDHIMAVQSFLVEKPNLPVYIHKEDANFLIDASKNLSTNFVKDKFILRPSNLRLLNDKDEVTFFDKTVKCLHLPGHTPGSCMYVIEDDSIIFSGDVLFSKSIGRFDLPYGNRMDTIESLKKIKSIQKDYNIYPGHDEKTTLLEEKQLNPYLLQIN